MGKKALFETKKILKIYFLNPLNKTASVADKFSHHHSQISPFPLKQLFILFLKLKGEKS
jgi:hypothetical protein